MVKPPQVVVRICVELECMFNCLTLEFVCDWRLGGGRFRADKVTVVGVSDGYGLLEGGLAHWGVPELVK